MTLFTYSSLFSELIMQVIFFLRQIRCNNYRSALRYLFGMLFVGSFLCADQSLSSADSALLQVIHSQYVPRAEIAKIEQDYNKQPSKVVEIYKKDELPFSYKRFGISFGLSLFGAYLGGVIGVIGSDYVLQWCGVRLPNKRHDIGIISMLWAGGLMTYAAGKFDMYVQPKYRGQCLTHKIGFLIAALTYSAVGIRQILQGT